MASSFTGVTGQPLADSRAEEGVVAALVRQCLRVQVIDVPTTGCASNLETICTVISNSTNRLLTLCLFYCHPIQTVAQISADLDDLEHQLQYVLAVYPGTAVIAGDHNLNQLKTSSVHVHHLFPCSPFC